MLWGLGISKYMSEAGVGCLSIGREGCLCVGSWNTCERGVGVPARGGLEYLMVKGVVHHGVGMQTMDLGQGYS